MSATPLLAIERDWRPNDIYKNVAKGLNIKDLISLAAQLLREHTSREEVQKIYEAHTSPEFWYFP